eukprot:TRINITY_DN3189_c0_g1_i6.p1 TRINITY_DN3189_c0_g1~~TRINITY_DN3189_c0_g1_i6.p1  ORF type:complete len:319 (+),score=45.85 TRINITY_DN3189_c0_g1_i6:42-959(+)
MSKRSRTAMEKSTTVKVRSIVPPLNNSMNGNNTIRNEVEVTGDNTTKGTKRGRQGATPVIPPRPTSSFPTDTLLNRLDTLQQLGLPINPPSTSQSSSASTSSSRSVSPSTTTTIPSHGLYRPVHSPSGNSPELSVSPKLLQSTQTALDQVNQGNQNKFSPLSVSSSPPMATSPKVSIGKLLRASDEQPSFSVHQDTSASQNMWDQSSGVATWQSTDDRITLGRSFYEETDDEVELLAAKNSSSSFQGFRLKVDSIDDEARADPEKERKKAKIAKYDQICSKVCCPLPAFFLLQPLKTTLVDFFHG